MKQEITPAHSPELLEKLESLSKGSTDLIINQWLEEQRIKSINTIKIIDNKKDIQLQSLYSGVIVSALAIALGAYGIYAKAELSQLALLIAPIATLAGVFIWQNKRKDLE